MNRRPGTAVGTGTGPGAGLPRVVVLWCPDWPVTAAIRAAGLPADAPVALIAKGVVFACSASARAEGIARGLRLREAQARLPHLTALDNRAFEPLIAAVEHLVPGVQLVRPGVCAVRIRGAARYYGGERAAALALTSQLDELGAGGARAGIGDGLFTAEQAARRANPVHIVAEGGAAEFLAPLDVGLLEEGQPGIVTLLRRLGIRTLGEFAQLGADDVRLRFGEQGARVHALSGGRDSLPLSPRTPPRDLDVIVDFEPALDRVDQVAFGVRAAAERFIDDLTAVKLVCTAIRVELDSDPSQLPTSSTEFAGSCRVQA